jgi:hypothetical protein
MTDLKLVANSHWRDNVRDDGLRIERMLGHWVIVPKNATRDTLSRCPCCDNFLASLRHAQLVADKSYPFDAS